MSLLIYGAIFWIFAIISSILQDRFPDVGVASYQTVVKAIPTLSALIYVLLFRPSGALFYLLLVVSFFFCVLGDVAMEKDIVPGIGMFLLAHLFFTVNFLWQAIMLSMTITTIFIGIVILVGFVFYVFLYIRYLKSDGREIPDFVLKAGTFYFILISATLSTSILLWLASGILWGILPVVGALFFIISDSTIALNEFHHRISHNELIIMPTYYLAIFLLSLGAVVFVF